MVPRFTAQTRVVAALAVCITTMVAFIPFVQASYNNAVLLQQSSAQSLRAAGKPAATMDGGAVAVEQLLQRVLGPSAASKFSLSIDANDEGDVFTLHESDEDKPVISGSNPVSLASGVYWYLRYYANCSMSWGVNGTADNLDLPSPLPAITTSMSRTNMVRYRYYQNVCTVSYSMAFWDWARWQREIDWMALNSINLPLAFTGQEHIWAEVYASMGLTEADLEEHFAGLGFLAWERMGNMRGWGGPLLPQFRQAQASLQLQILGRMRELGMTPVLGAFAGHVPKSLMTLFPKANITRSPDWGRFGNDYCCDYLLSPFDDLFPVIGKKFIEAQTKLYGTDHVYNTDTFNEMDPATNDPEYLKAASAAVYNGMAAADPDAVWLMQGWLFHSSFWGQSEIAAYLSGVNSSNMIILDLNSEQEPLWKDFYENDKPFVWCMLHNYGGARNMYGQVDLIASAPFAAKSTAKSTMIGTGITMEAIEQNPVMYELMLEVGWHDAAFDGSEWLSKYATRRYGGQSPSAEKAWDILHWSAYNYGFSWDGNSLIVKNPSLSMPFYTALNATGMVEAWRAIVHSAAEFPNGINGPWEYDCVDIARQALSDIFYDMHQLLAGAFVKCSGAFTDEYTKHADTDNPGYDIKQVGDCGILRDPPVPCNITFLEEQCNAIENCAGFNSNGYLKTDSTHTAPSKGTDFYARQRSGSAWDECKPAVLAWSAAMKKAILDVDSLLATNVNYLLGVWIQTARALGSSEKEKDLMEFNARNQITLWGPTGNIDDYAAKNWAGLMKDYYSARWGLFFDALASAISSRSMPDWSKVTADILALGQQWCNETDPEGTKYPETPTGKPLTVASQLLSEYAIMPGNYETINDSSVGSSHVYYTAWNKDVATLANLCNVDPTCMGFTSTGLMSSSADGVIPAVGVTFYAKA